MKFAHGDQVWEVTRATEKPYVGTVDCRLPKACAAELVKAINKHPPVSMTLLGIRAARDHVSRQHRYWGFRLTCADGSSHLVEILHSPDKTVYNRITGKGKK